MHNFDSFLPMFLLVTRFAEVYSEGSYGGGGYSATSSPTTTPTNPTASPTTQSAPSSTSSTQTPQDGATTTTATDSDQPVTSTGDSTPRTTTSQPATQPDTTAESSSTISMDPITIMIGFAIAIAVLATVIVLIVKKMTRQ